MKKGWLSVIIPAYNPDEYLKKMLDSLTAQKAEYPNVDIIVVDDGSKNDVEWLKEYPGIKYKRKRNGGDASARNAGMALAKGEYITFIDCDDEIADNYLAIIFQNMREGYDWVSYDWTCDGHKEWAYQNFNILKVNCAVWAYSFRAEFIGDHRFDESLKSASDQKLLEEILRDDCKHKHDHRIIINYRWAGNNNSLTHRKARGEFST